MLNKFFSNILLTLSAITFFAIPALADGFIVPYHPHIIDYPSIREVPNLSVKYHKVDVSIDNQIAKTKIDQVFLNEYNRDLEGTYIFPLSPDAMPDKFVLYSGTEKIEGKILDRDKARDIYERIVSQRRDPGILEYIGKNMFQARIFPIPGNGEKRVGLEYSEMLKSDNDVIRYVYPLNTEKFSTKPLEKVEINIKIKSKEPIKSIYSPSHEIKVEKIDDHTATVSFEDKKVKPNTDFTLYYTVSRDDIGLNLLTYNNGKEDGYFLLMAAPKVTTANKDIAKKNILFVIDVSGSMAGEKIEQAKGALEFCLNNLNSKDKFNIIAFTDDVQKYEDKDLLDANKNEIKKAVNYARKLTSLSGTNINEALLTGLKMLKNKKDPNIIFFLTDGEPTVGETNTPTILDNVKKANDNNRIFIFGVGFDVNIHFLDKMGLENKGVAEYVRPEENIEVKVSNLFSKVSNPILTDLTIDFGSKKVVDIFPRQYPDIFKGSQILVVGRYKKSGKITITLSGMVEGQKKTFSIQGYFPSAESTQNEFLPRLWAARKIGFLLDEIRLKGKIKELVEEVVRLSKKYGIITEYTAFLVEEDTDIKAPPGMLMKKADEKLKAAGGVDKGSWAISQSRNIQGLQNQAAAPQNVFLDTEGEKKQITQVQNISQRAFYQRKNTWIDGDVTESMPVIKIQKYSEAYFQLTRNFSDMNKYLSLSEDITFVWNKQAIQIGDEGKTTLTDQEIKDLGKQ